MKPLLKTLLWITVFSIAMGYMEAVIVVYLRDLYYPSGFRFPLKLIGHTNASAEFWREVATIVMLYSIGYLAGKNRPQRFAFFIYSFAIWDLFYYVFLKVLLDWPETLLTWDILFLIPMPWVGPVLAPCIVSFTLISIALCVLYFNEKGTEAKFIKREKSLMITGCFVIIVSFVKDYALFILQNHDVHIWTPISRMELFGDIVSFVPDQFSWWLFWVGELCIIAGLVAYFIRQNRYYSGRLKSQKE